MTLIEFANLKLAVLTVIAQVFLLLSVAYFLFFQKDYPAIKKFFSKYGLTLSLIVALSATAGSLFYSEVAGYTPCTLCWYQRIFMYPQVFLLGLAMIKKDRGIIKYSLLLSAAGWLLAAYHYLMQIGFINGSCAVVGYSASCTKLFVMRFGYITIPLMSLTAFSAIIVLLVFSKKNQ